MNISILFQQTHFLSIAAQNSVICFYSFNGTPSQLNESWHHICKVYRRIYNCCTFNIAWCIDKKRNVYTEFSWKVFASLYLLLYSGFRETIDRKSTRLNSSHVAISYAVFCLKKKTIKSNNINDTII